MLIFIAILLAATGVQCNIDERKQSLPDSTLLWNEDFIQKHAGNQSNSTTLKELDNDAINSSSTKIDETGNTTHLDFFILKESPSREANKIWISKQFERHSYNINANNTNSQDNIDFKNSTSIEANQPASFDPLDTSDTKPVTRIDQRYDDSEVQSLSDSYADELDTSIADAEGYIDEASSNMNEKKVVRELTKILSKGMSGASDQIRVETLENLKRRQQERKALKDNRAKLFEEILTTAINNHPDKLKRQKSKSKSRNQSLGGNPKPASSATSSSSSSYSSSSSSSEIPSSEPDLELSADAELVLQHLHGLASSVDQSASLTGSDALSPTPTVSEAESEADSSSNDSGSNSSNENQTEDRPKKVAASTDRPILRQFRKIRNQLSQRRKQLDQIKKLINTELALNPKDGSFVSKQTTPSSKKKQPQTTSNESEQGNNLSEFGENFGQNKRSRTTSTSSNRLSEKSRELLTYLRNNPEILASVMAELTVDADPTSRTQEFNRPEDNLYQQNQYSQVPELDEMSLASLRSKKLATRYQKLYPHQSIDNTDDIISPRWQRPGRTDGTSRLTNDLDSVPLLSSRRVRSRVLDRQQISGRPIITQMRQLQSKSPEELLLESLRERQLLNLARLDSVLAERAVANKTVGYNSVFHYPTQSLNFNGNLLNGRSLYPAEQTDGFQRASSDHNDRRSSPSHVINNSSRSTSSQTVEDDETHHFMIVGPNKTESLFKTLNNDLLPSYGSSSNQSPRSQQQIYQRQSVLGQLPAVKHFVTIANSNNSYPFAYNPNPNLVQSNQVNQQRPHSNNHIPQQSSDGTLKRFMDWRDVSQDASSWSSDKTSLLPRTNISWTSPYDLTTGSSSSMDLHAARSPSMINYSLQKANANNQQQSLVGHKQSLSVNNLTSLEPGQHNGQFVQHKASSGATFDQLQQQQPLKSVPKTLNQSSNTLSQKHMDNLTLNTLIRNIEPDTSTVRLPFDEKRRNDRLHIRGSRLDSTNSREYDTSDKYMQTDYDDVSESTSSKPDYFKSYKDEELRFKKNTRSHRLKNQDIEQSEIDKNTETEESGAMWA